MWGHPVQVTVLLTGLALAAGPVAAQPDRPHSQAEALALGRSLVVRNCGPCHAVGRSDVSPKPAAPAFRDLSQRYDVEALGEALAEGILTGHPEMPEFRFAPHEVDAILRYLQSIQVKQQGGRPKPGARGRRAALAGVASGPFGMVSRGRESARPQSVRE